METASLQSIAERARVSTMTVSRVLRNHPHVASTTRERVLAAAAELNYRPNPLVSALMSARRTGRSSAIGTTIAFLTDFPSPGAWQKQTLFSQFFTGASAAADRHGYKLEELWMAQPGFTSERISEILYNRGICGVLVAPLPGAQGHLDLDWSRLSAVALGYTLLRPALHRAVNHQFRSMRTAIRELRLLGYTRPGLALQASLNVRVFSHWLGAFLVEQFDSSEAHLPAPLLLEDSEWSQTNFLNWFNRERPDVVIGHANAPLRWLRESGVSVPGQIGFVQLNCESPQGPQSGIYQNGPVVGEVAIEFLIGMLQRNERGVPPLAHSILVDGSWVPGKTVRKQ